MSGHPDYPFRHEAVEDAVALCKSMQATTDETRFPAPARSVELFDVLEVASFLLGERDREVEGPSITNVWNKIPHSGLEAGHPHE